MAQHYTSTGSTTRLLDKTNYDVIVKSQIFIADGSCERSMTDIERQGVEAETPLRSPDAG